MLRQFSTRRVVGTFLLDWLGTLFMLLLATYLVSGAGGFPASFEWVGSILARLMPPKWLSDAAAARGALSPQVLLIVSILWPFFFYVFSVYDGRHSYTIKRELSTVILAITAATLTFAGVLYLSYRDTSRLLFVTFFLLDLSLLLSSRLLWWFYRSRMTWEKSGIGSPTVIVGAGEVGRQVAADLRRFAAHSIRPIGFLDDAPEKREQQSHGLPVLGTLDQVEEIAEHYEIQNAVIALPLSAHLRLIEVCSRLQAVAINVSVIPDLFALSFPNARLDGFGGIPVISLGQPGIHGSRRFMKRLFDVVTVTSGLVILSPLLILIALLIKLDSPGAVIFRQERIGENGQPFTMYKFRTMYVNSDSEVHRQHVTRLIRENICPNETDTDSKRTLKMTDDPRITPVGRVIRKLSLDELPQVLNVLKGDMSLVGPRPPLPYEVEVYQEWHRRRLETLPGITGPWQVKARNQVNFDEMVRMDLEYIRSHSFWTDLVLILQTPLALIRGKGAG